MLDRRIAASERTGNLLDAYSYTRAPGACDANVRALARA